MKFAHGKLKPEVFVKISINLVRQTIGLVLIQNDPQSSRLSELSIYKIIRVRDLKTSLFDLLKYMSFHHPVMHSNLITHYGESALGFIRQLV
jgi:hypothetical protein